MPQIRNGVRRLQQRWTKLYRQLLTGVESASHIPTLDRILREPLGQRSLRAMFGETSDDFWLWCFTGGYRRDERLRAMLPGFPSDQVQFQFTGRAGDETMREIFPFYRLVRTLVQQHMTRRCESVLDFGCGWGRIIRCFLRDVEADRLWGIDCMPEAIEICKGTNRFCRFELVDPFPPTRLPDEAFDLIYAYSVFSHLSEHAHLAWLSEFNRLLKPGGLLIATTRPRTFILTCAKTRAAGDKRDWAQGTAQAFKDTEAALATFDRGEFLYDPIGAGGVLDASFFGETCIPLRYVLDNWTRLFEFVRYVDDRRMCLQNVIVVRKSA